MAKKRAKSSSRLGDGRNAPLTRFLLGVPGLPPTRSSSLFAAYNLFDSSRRIGAEVVRRRGLLALSWLRGFGERGTVTEGSRNRWGILDSYTVVARLTPGDG